MIYKNENVRFSIGFTQVKNQIIWIISLKLKNQTKPNLISKTKSNIKSNQKLFNFLKTKKNSILFRFYKKNRTTWSHLTFSFYLSLRGCWYCIFWMHIFKTAKYSLKYLDKTKLETYIFKANLATLVFISKRIPNTP